MQSVEIQGLDRVVKALENMPEVIREARAEVMEEMGQELLGAVQQRIGGTGRIADVQDYHVGSGKGYVAVRAKADTELDGYAAGYITNALEGGHAFPGQGVQGLSRRERRERQSSNQRVPGKYMYRDTDRQDVDRLTETAAQRIEDVAIKALDGGTT